MYPNIETLVYRIIMISLLIAALVVNFNREETCLELQQTNDTHGRYFIVASADGRNLTGTIYPFPDSLSEQRLKLVFRN